MGVRIAGIAYQYSDYTTTWRIRISNPGRGMGIFSLKFRPVLRPTQHLIQWIPVSFPGCKAAGA